MSTTETRFAETNIAPAFDNTYARELEGFYVEWQADRVPSPELIQFNRALARELGLEPDNATADAWAEVFAGNATLPGAHPIAQAYAGHQFGGFSPKLGDGRALLLGEVVSRSGDRFDIQLKGSGSTPFSRGADGKAALGPVLREYLMAEAMHALGVPTTRALAAVTTGEKVVREDVLPGAVLTRVASSHIRVGTFQFFAVRRAHDQVEQLVHYTINRHYPDATHSERPALALFEAVGDAQAKLIAKWLSLGFVHGVMNTDNMTVSGETIDYGPCAFIDAYDPNAVYSSIDTGGRYAYGNQPLIAQWNLARFAETLIPVLGAEPEAAAGLLTEQLESFSDRFARYWLAEMRRKLGFASDRDGDLNLINELLGHMAAAKADFTGTFRQLAAFVRGGGDALDEKLVGVEGFSDWLEEFQARIADEEGTPEECAAAMDAVNPVYIPRNHKVEEALDAAVTEGDLEPFNSLLALVTQPFVVQPGQDAYAAPAPPAFGRHVTYCGT